MEQFALSEYEAQLLTLDSQMADYYEDVATRSGNPKASANYALNDLMAARNRFGDDEHTFPISADHLAELIRIVDAGTISATVARQELFQEMYTSGRAPAELVRERGLEQVSDESVLEGLVQQVLDEHAEQFAQYVAGKSSLLGFFVGKVMKASGGKANPRTVNRLLQETLEKR